MLAFFVVAASAFRSIRHPPAESAAEEQVNRGMRSDHLTVAYTPNRPRLKNATGIQQVVKKFFRLQYTNCCLLCINCEAAQIIEYFDDFFQF